MRSPSLNTRYLVWTGIMVLLPVLICCTKSPSFDQITVGMTYDEVESLFGRPEAIERGAREIKLDVDDLSLSELSLINPRINPSAPRDDQQLEISYANLEILESQLKILEDTTNADSSKWSAPYRIQTVGNLIYVAWRYKDEKVETNYVPVRQLKSGSVTDTIRIPHYLVNDKEVTKIDYDLVSDFVYRHPDGSIIGKSVWQAYKSSGLFQVPQPERARKRVSIELKLKTESRDFVETEGRKNYVVVYRFSVIFDSSSGRVVSSGYFPISVTPL